MKTPMTKLLLAAFAAFSLCLGARALEQDTDGYYMLGSVQDWRDFAALVETDMTLNAKMIADIDLGDDQTMIGSYAHPYAGEFDGQGYTLTINYDTSSLAVDAGQDAATGGYGYFGAGPFRDINGATIRNLHTTGEIVADKIGAAGIVGWTYGTNTIERCWSAVNISSTSAGADTFAGIVAFQYGERLNIRDSLYTGRIQSQRKISHGGFVGYNHVGGSYLDKCLLLLAEGSDAEASNIRWNFFTFVRTVGTTTTASINDCYYRTAFGIVQGAQATVAQLADGTIATALQAGREETVWVQGGDGPMLAIFVREKETITWLNDDGTEIDTTEVVNGAMPTHADPTKSATAPYRYVFTGWTPALEPAVSNTTYAATFQKIADLALVESDWTAADGDTITGETTYNVSIPGGAKVTINGVSVTGIGGGAAVDAPSFSESGESAVTKFECAGDTWTLTAFAEMEGDSVGTAVTDGQIKVYAADTVEGLESASPMTSGVTVTEKKSAVKTTIEVTPPAPTAPAQFFKVKFGS